MLPLPRSISREIGEAWVVYYMYLTIFVFVPCLGICSQGTPRETRLSRVVLANK